MQETLDHICFCSHNIEEHDYVDEISMCYKCNCTFWQPLDYELGEWKNYE